MAQSESSKQACHRLDSAGEPDASDFGQENPEKEKAQGCCDLMVMNDGKFGLEPGKAIDWSTPIDRSEDRSSAKKGARTLSIAFAVFRVALVITAIISVSKVVEQVQTKHWFQNHLMSLTFITRAYSDVKTAKCRVFEYAMSGGEEKLNEAERKLLAAHMCLQHARTYLTDPEALALIDRAENATESTVETVLHDSQRRHHTLTREASLKAAEDELFSQNDIVTDPFYRLHGGLVTRILETSSRFKQELQHDGLQPILILLGAYALLLAALTRAYLQQRQRNLKILAASEAQVHVLLDNMHDGIAVIDAERLIDSSNQKLADLLGFKTREELKGRSIEELFGQDISEIVIAVSDSAFSLTKEATATPPNAPPFPVELCISSVVTPAGPRSLVTVRDITLRKRSEDWKRNMLAVVSHDLRTPLTAMRGSLELISMGALGTVPPDLTPYVNTAQINAHKLINIINDLLDLEKLESRREAADLVPVELTQLLSQAIEEKAPEAEAKQIVIQARCPDEKVMADSLRLQQLVEHLLDNAIRFSPPESVVEVAVSKQSDWIELRISDQGRGIPETMKESIFQRMTQVLPEDRLLGPGLGLAICRAIAELHESAIGVESQEGQGSSFWILLKSAPIQEEKPILSFAGSPMPQAEPV